MDEQKRQIISERIKAGLAAAKRRGVKIGGYRGAEITARMQKASKAVRAAGAYRRAFALAPVIVELRAGGCTSLRAIAAGLTARGIPTARGGSWSAKQVLRVLARQQKETKAQIGLNESVR